MAKQKKITVRHYLNKNLKPEIESNISYYPLYVSITVNSKNIKKRNQSIWYNVSEQQLKKDKDTIRLVEYEKDLYTRVIERYLSDIENKNVNTSYLYVFASKGYKSKDSFINQLNSYLDFYSYSIFDAVSNYCDMKIENEIYKKIENTFKFNELDNIQEIFKFQPNHSFDSIQFLLNNLSDESLKYLILREWLRDFLSPYSIETGYDIPYIDWIENKIQDKFETFLKTYEINSEDYLPSKFEFTDKIIENYINIIDSVVKSDDYINLMR